MEKIEVTHENVLYSCCGGFANCGLLSLLACIEVVKEIGFAKVSLGCLGAVPLNNQGVINKTKAAKRVITVDGCANQCARKLLENAGLEITKSIEIVRDIKITKIPWHQKIQENPKCFDEVILKEDIEKVKEIILKALQIE
jgi:uncharacterized metal-binding protein